MIWTRATRYFGARWQDTAFPLGRHVAPLPKKRGHARAQLPASRVFCLFVRQAQDFSRERYLFVTDGDNCRFIGFQSYG